MIKKTTLMKVILLILLFAMILLSASCMKTSTDTGTGGTPSEDMPESSSVGSTDLPSGNVSSGDTSSETSSQNPSSDSPSNNPESQRDELMEELMSHSATPGIYFEIEEVSAYYRTAKITQYTGQEEIVVIPEKINGYTIVEVGTKAFYQNKNVRAIKLADTIGLIDSGAFGDCPELEIFVCGSGTKEFTTKTFAKDRKLRKVILNEGFENLGSHSFNSCISLKEIELPSTITGGMAHTFWCFERKDKIKVYYNANNEPLNRLKEELDNAHYETTCVLIPR